MAEDERLTCTRAQLRNIFGVSQTRFTQFLAEGMPKAIGRGIYDATACVQWWMERKLRAHGQTARRTQTDYYNEVARLKHLERRRLETTLLEREAVELLLREIGQGVADFAETFPAQVTEQLADTADPDAIEAILDRELRNARLVMADRLRAFELKGGVRLEPRATADYADPPVGEDLPQTAEG